MSTTQRQKPARKGKTRWLRRLACVLFPVTCYLGTASGCTWDRWYLFTSPPAPPPPDSFVLGADGLQPDKRLNLSQGDKDLGGAHEVFRKGDYSQAEAIYHGIADNKKNTVQVAEEARFYEAESLRLQGAYPKACDTYHKVLIDFPSGVYREQAIQHMYDIANGWLDDTREEMEAVREKKAGKRLIVWPSFVHFEKTKPLLDEEGRALETLTQVRYSDMTGPLADKALFLAGSVHFFNEDYKEADQDFTQLVEMHPSSPLVEKAIELGIIAKHLSTGGSDYDGRKVAEARQLVQTALDKYPTLRAQKSDFLTRQLIGITFQQAEKDFKIAEFYRRTGHPGSAYFYYEIVRRRYPGTAFFDQATQRMHELKAEQEAKHGSAPAPEVPLPTKPETPAPGTGIAQRQEAPPAPRTPPPAVPETPLPARPVPNDLQPVLPSAPLNPIPVLPPTLSPSGPVPLGPSTTPAAMSLPPS